LLKQYYRPLTQPEKSILEKQVTESKSFIQKTLVKAIVLTLVTMGFAAAAFRFPKIWFIITVSAVSLFVIMHLYYAISDLIRTPNFLRAKKEVIKTGVAKVIEIHIDRYIKIDNFEDEGNHFIVEYNGMLSLIGGQEFLKVNKLKNKIEQIEIMDAKKTGIYYEMVKKVGNNLDPYYTFKKGLPATLLQSEIWERLADGNALPGRLEDLNKFIPEDKHD
jgi:hypothetical protein